ncbi:MAG TPA: lipopolysaccharide transport periplasmic protein LptA [Candidatus Sulfotelmatobacter sp.]|nr:lipopolysaccharide transport periplasmic protein LptA [Candidatus Sulfotelmatobacter sp.]
MSRSRRYGMAMLILLVASAAASAAQPPAPRQATPITISSDNLEVDRKARVAIYRGNVAANDQGRGFSILADKIEFFFDEQMEEVEHATATGNVRLTYGERRGVAERAEYFPAESRAVLLGNPKVWQENDVITGCKITLLLREDRSQVDGCDGQRVNAVLYPKRGESGTGRR